MSNPNNKIKYYKISNGSLDNVKFDNTLIINTSISDKHEALKLPIKDKNIITLSNLNLISSLNKDDDVTSYYLESVPNAFEILSFIQLPKELTIKTWHVNDSLNSVTNETLVYDLKRKIEDFEFDYNFNLSENLNYNEDDKLTKYVYVRRKDKKKPENVNKSQQNPQQTQKIVNDKLKEIRKSVNKMKSIVERMNEILSK